MAEHRRDIVSGVTAVFFALCVLGCGEPTGALPEMHLSADADAAVASSLPTTRYISQGTEGSVIAFTEQGATIVLDANSQVGASLAIGDFLVFGITSWTPDGLLRRVTSSTLTADGVTVETVQATFPEVFGSFDFDTPLPLLGDDEGGFRLELEEAVIFDGDDDARTTHDQVLVSGTVVLSVDLVLEIETQWNALQRLRVTTRVDQQTDLYITATGPAMEFDHDIPVALLTFEAMEVGSVVLRPEIELRISVIGALSAPTAVELVGGLHVAAGTAHEAGKWKPFSHFSTDWDPHAPTITDDGWLHARVGPRVAVRLFGLPGPYVTVRGTMDLDAKVDAEPWWEMFAGLEIHAGVSSDILGATVSDTNTKVLTDEQELLAQASIPPSCRPSCSRLECGDGGCPELYDVCGVCGDGEICIEGLCFPEPCQHDCGDEVYIPEGAFWQGCNLEIDDSCDPDESPLHEVYLDGFYIDRTEVTQAAFAVCVEAGHCAVPECDWQPELTPNRPVVCIDLADAETFCATSGKRLPTEAEWEKAARGTDGRVYPWGNEPATCELTVMADCADVTQPVCSTSPGGDSPYGLCDMAGNALEWVSDWYKDSYYEVSPGTNPEGPQCGFFRSVRGGCFTFPAVYVRCSNRFYITPQGDGFYLGFRCARDE